MKFSYGVFGASRIFKNDIGLPCRPVLFVPDNFTAVDSAEFTKDFLKD